MAKYRKKFDIKEMVVHWLTCHRWLKLLALLLAIVLWLYVKDELRSLQQTLR
jgi:hypothetical protein